MRHAGLMLIGVGLVCLCAILASPALSQEEEKAEALPTPAQGTPKLESLYGEILAVNETAGSLTVQYYDYDTDEEKDVELALDKDTKLENAASIKDVKSGDWVDVSYAPGEGGKKLVKSIRVEKAEEAAATSGVSGEDLADEGD